MQARSITKGKFVSHKTELALPTKTTRHIAYWCTKDKAKRGAKTIASLNLLEKICTQK